MRFKKLIVAVLAVCSTVCMAPKTLLAQQSLNNDAVIKLVKAGLSDDLIVSTINSQTGTYDTSTDGLIALKTAGVSDKVVNAIVTKGTTPVATPTPATVILAAPPPPLPGVTDVGVYFKDKNGQWSDAISENVNFKTGGFLKSMASDGIVKPDLNGHITGPASTLRLTKQAEFVLYVMEGQSAGDYQLLHLHAHKDGREFRSVTGGVVHASSGAERDTIEFTSKKVAPHTYIITLPAEMEVGEYGFLPPGNMNSGKNLASSGKIYTFSIIE
jgi:hypothetical protein